VFFALWPEAELAARLRQAVSPALRSCHGRQIAASNWHITLVFLGAVDRPGLDCLQTVADRSVGQAFELRLDHLAYWPRPKIIFLAPTEIPQALIHLQADLSRSLATACGYQPEIRPYRPHLSLIRKAQQGPAQARVEPVEWPVTSFALVHSVTHAAGAEYRVLKQWPLAD